MGMHVWAGAWLYWGIGLFSTRTPKVRDVARSVKYEPGLIDRAIGGTVQYFDGLLLDNDARFVWDFVAQAKSFGAEALNYTSLTAATSFNLSLNNYYSTNLGSCCLDFFGSICG